MTKSDKILLIQEEMADKSKTFGCLVSYDKKECYYVDSFPVESWCVSYDAPLLYIKTNMCSYTVRLNKREKKKMKIIWHPVTLEDILIRAKSKWWNMVCNNYWKILFNKSWTPEADWSYREFERMLWNPLSEQSDETINSLSDLILLVKGDAKQN